MGDAPVVATGLLPAVTSALGTVLEWIGTTITAVTNGQLKELLPLFAIGIAISVVFLGIKAIRSIVWGA